MPLLVRARNLAIRALASARYARWSSWEQALFAVDWTPPSVLRKLEHAFLYAGASILVARPLSACMGAFADCYALPFDAAGGTQSAAETDRKLHEVQFSRRATNIWETTRMRSCLTLVACKLITSRFGACAGWTG